MRLTVTCLLAALSLSACTWVNQNPAGESVAITDISSLTQCKKIGDISSRTKHKIGFIPRGEAKILSELQTLARNEAIKLGANTITANGDPVDGSQTYQAFLCPR